MLRILGWKSAHISQAAEQLAALGCHQIPVISQALLSQAGWSQLTALILCQHPGVSRMPGRRQNYWARGLCAHPWAWPGRVLPLRRTAGTRIPTQWGHGATKWPLFSLGLKVAVRRQVSVLLSAVNPCSLELRGETRSLIPSLLNQEGLA